MTVHELSGRLRLNKLSDGTDKEIASCYVSDLLSRVLSGCRSGDIWITVQSSINMVAVALMVEASCVILPEGLTVSDDVVDKASAEGLTIFSSRESAYSLASRIAQFIL